MDHVTLVALLHTTDTIQLLEAVIGLVRADIINLETAVSATETTITVVQDNTTQMVLVILVVLFLQTDTTLALILVTGNVIRIITNLETLVYTVVLEQDIVVQDSITQMVHVILVVLFLPMVTIQVQTLVTGNVVQDIISLGIAVSVITIIRDQTIVATLCLQTPTTRTIQVVGHVIQGTCRSAISVFGGTKK